VCGSSGDAGARKTVSNKKKRLSNGCKDVSANGSVEVMFVEDRNEAILIR
jgi:hypothetical protein